MQNTSRVLIIDEADANLAQPIHDEQAPFTRKQHLILRGMQPSLRDRIRNESTVERIDKMLSDLREIKTISNGTMKRIEVAADERKKELLAEQENGTVSSTEQETIN